MGSRYHILGAYRITMPYPLETTVFQIVLQPKTDETETSWSVKTVWEIINLFTSYSNFNAHTDSYIVAEVQPHVGLNWKSTVWRRWLRTT